MDSRRAVQEWDQYLRDRHHNDGPPDFRTARKLLKHRYSEDDLPRAFSKPDGNARENARYEAERDFFDCFAPGGRPRDVEDLLARIVDQRYRDYNDDDCEVVFLKGIPARRVIAAERLFQRKLLMLKGEYPVCIGLDVGRSSGGRLGPAERFRVHHACEEPDDGQGSSRGSSGPGPRVFYQYFDFEWEHRSESPDYGREVNAHRLGDKFARHLGKYADDGRRRGIVSLLEDTLHYDLNDRQSELVRVFREFASDHCVSNKLVRRMERQYKEELLNLCFLILECEQSQWQSAYYLTGDLWKLGMTVSFARLVRLFGDGHINLHDMFFKYGLYSSQNLIKNFDRVKKTCSDIDRLYQSYYRDLDLNDSAEAYEDLKYLYGKRM